MAKVYIRKAELNFILQAANRAAHRSNGRVVLDTERLVVVDEDDEPRPSETTRDGKNYLDLK